MLLRRGDHGPSVAAVRSILSSLGYIPADLTTPDADAVYTADLYDAVRSFQQNRGLIVDGVVGSMTLASLTDARYTLGDRTLAYALSAQMTGDDVMALQERLAELGYDTGQTDGVFGAKTDEALREYQRNRGLPDDGVFGRQTLEDLRRMGRMVTGGRPNFLREKEIARQRGPGLRGKRIVIDPSLGGDDYGWVVDGVRASDLIFDIAHRLEGRMAATGMETFLTRGESDNPSQAQRANVANRIDADIVLSLHIDGSSSALGQGLATFHFGTDSGSSSTLGETLAQLVHRELLARTKMVDCRVHHRPWDLLRLTQMPAVRIELGYLTNPVDREALIREDFRDTVADGILVAVKRLYLDGRDEPHTGTFTFKDLLAYEQSRTGLS
ncbi:N-acetylmuramoyl-L-alanine amidase [Nakamurella antarctica]|uniref:N-acetylmuramoyl-L-alanine amidase n=1 Tax=Nakamurella antarctica TaxID=1902245 RepID=A0A3G8ZR56_9ACTN|nr:N-acetylmuramoyl-L-alanine amidase [Nakamurella antarctica]AZI59277.1 N-acetylmuramoyl-L-alanine amidase [Nakamurella antarctica]